MHGDDEMKLLLSATTGEYSEIGPYFVLEHFLKRFKFDVLIDN